MKGSSAEESLVCIPCQEDRSLFSDPAKNIRHFAKRLDHQLIDIERITDKSSFAEYAVTTKVSDNDPRFRSRSIRVGTATGYIRLYKETGNFEVIYPVPGDDKGSIIKRAESVLRKAHIKNEYPIKTCYTSG